MPPKARPKTREGIEKEIGKFFATEASKISEADAAKNIIAFYELLKKEKYLQKYCFQDDNPTDPEHHRLILIDRQEAIDQYNFLDDDVDEEQKAKYFIAFFAIREFYRHAEHDGFIKDPDSRLYLLLEDEDGPLANPRDLFDAMKQSTSLPDNRPFYDYMFDKGRDVNKNAQINPYKEKEGEEAPYNEQLLKEIGDEAARAQTKVAANFRGHLVRKKLKEEKLRESEKTAATKIQRKFRAWREKKKMQEHFKIKGSKEGFFDRDSLIDSLPEKEFSLDPPKSLREIRGSKEPLKKSLSYFVTGYSDVIRSGSSSYPHDDIRMNSQGIYYSVYQASGNVDGVVKLQEHVDRARLAMQGADKGEKSLSLVKIEGKRFKTTINPTTRTVDTQEEFDPLFSLIHQNGRNVTQTFLDRSVIEKIEADIKSQFEEEKDKANSSLRDYKIKCFNAISENPQYASLTEDERYEMANQMVITHLRQKAQDKLMYYVEQSVENCNSRFRNSHQALEDILETKSGLFGGTLKSRESLRMSIHNLKSVGNPSGPVGISITKDPRNLSSVKVLFRQDNPGDKIDDICYIAVPNTSVHMAVRYAAKGGEVTYYENGISKTKLCKQGEVVMDINTAMFFDAKTKQYVPIRVHGQANPKKGEVDMKTFFRAPGDAARITRSIDRMNIQAFGMLESDIETTVKFSGKKKPVSVSLDKAVGANCEVTVLLDTSKIELDHRDFLANPLSAQDGSTLDIREDGSIRFDFPDLGESFFGKGEFNKKTNEFKFSKDTTRKYDASRKLKLVVRSANASDVVEVGVGKKQVKGPGGIVSGVFAKDGKAGDATIVEVVDENGEVRTVADLRDEFGDKFVEELSRIKLAAIVRDQRKVYEEQFRDAAKKGDVRTLQGLLNLYRSNQERIAEIVAQVDFAMLYPALSKEDIQAKKESMFQSLNEQYNFDIFATSDFVAGKKNALHLAAEGNHKEVVDLLLLNGFNPKQRCDLKSKRKDKETMTAADLATYRGHRDLSSHLRDKALHSQELSDLEFKRQVTSQALASYEDKPSFYDFVNERLKSVVNFPNPPLIPPSQQYLVELKVIYSEIKARFDNLLKMPFDSKEEKEALKKSLFRDIVTQLHDVGGLPPTKISHLKYYMAYCSDEEFSKELIDFLSRQELSKEKTPLDRSFYREDGANKYFFELVQDTNDPTRFGFRVADGGNPPNVIHEAGEFVVGGVPPFNDKQSNDKLELGRKGSLDETYQFYQDLETRFNAVGGALGNGFQTMTDHYVIYNPPAPPAPTIIPPKNILDVLVQKNFHQTKDGSEFLKALVGKFGKDIEISQSLIDKIADPGLKEVLFEHKHFDVFYVALNPAAAGALAPGTRAEYMKVRVAKEDFTLIGQDGKKYEFKKDQLSYDKDNFYTRVQGDPANRANPSPLDQVMQKTPVGTAPLSPTTQDIERAVSGIYKASPPPNFVVVDGSDAVNQPAIKKPPEAVRALDIKNLSPARSAGVVASAA